MHGSTSRTVKAAAIMVAGFAGGGACIIVPGLHLVTTWALPLLGIVLGLRAYRTQASIDGGQGACPACGKPIDLIPIKVGADLASMTCPSCKEPVAIRLVDVPPGVR